MMLKSIKKLTISIAVFTSMTTTFMTSTFASNTTSIKPTTNTTNAVVNNNITLAGKTSNTIKVNAVFPVSGATGNKLEIINLSTKKAYNFDGIKQNNVLNGAYTAKALTPDTSYLIRLSYMSKNKLEFKEITVKTDKAQVVVQPTYKKITPKEAYDMMQKNKNYTLLDVRTKAEYDQKKIAGAISMPYTDVAKRAANELKDKNALIFVYCGNGSRSSIGAKQLVSLGYTNVYDFGGIIYWPYGTVNK